ncbi:MAG TPA: hypothetical protein VJU83_03620 [Burkholderiales bacterium]|nr:hypothetical protein [Burkholderiales bacterium]
MRALIVLIALGLCGCSKLTAENYAKIETGMTYEEVSAILGKADSCDDVAGFRSCKWGTTPADTQTEGKPTVSVQFVGNKAVLHSASNVR